MRFADYFGRAFSAVSASQFPWLKLFRESALSKTADVGCSTVIFLFFIFYFFEICYLVISETIIGMRVHKCLSIY